MKEKLQKLISAAGICSRRRAEEYINEGRVTVNGEKATLGMRADMDEDNIRVDGVLIKKQEALRYVMINKPKGYVATLSDERGRRTVAELVSDLGTRVYPVGRLDINSEGLLIMTNDGEAANRLMHPSHNVKKVYHVWVQGENLREAAKKLAQPMVIDGYKIRPAEVSILELGASSALFEVKISEGRNRQVRKMCAEVNLKVHRLVRIAEGELRLGDLQSGKWRSLSEKEIAYIKGIG